MKAIITLRGAEPVEVEFKGGIVKQTNTENAVLALSVLKKISVDEIKEQNPKIEFLKAAPKAKKADPKAAKKYVTPDYFRYSATETKRPAAPQPQDVPSGKAWIRRSTYDVYAAGMPEDLRPGGKGQWVDEAEAIKSRGLFWDSVTRTGSMHEGLFSPAS